MVWKDEGYRCPVGEQGVVRNLVRHHVVRKVVVVRAAVAHVSVQHRVRDVLLVEVGHLEGKFVLQVVGVVFFVVARDARTP